METLLKTPLRVCVCVCVCVCVHVYLRILGATSYSTFVPEGCVDSCSVVYEIIITFFFYYFTLDHKEVLVSSGEAVQLLCVKKDSESEEDG